MSVFNQIHSIPVEILAIYLNLSAIKAIHQTSNSSKCHLDQTDLSVYSISSDAQKLIVTVRLKFARITVK